MKIIRFDNKNLNKIFKKINKIKKISKISKIKFKN